MQPIRNQILFKPFIEQGKTEGGIFLPFDKESDKGEVVAVGGGTHKKPMYLKKGDIGYRVHDWGTPVKINGETLYLMEDDAILALA